MIEINAEQWKVYIDKYDRLIWTIARKISGDDAIANIDDNYSDLCIAALNSIDAYSRKTGKAINDFLTTKEFDQYTKTILWNYKAKKGIPLSNKMEFRNKHFSIDSITEVGEPSFDIEDTSVSSFGSFVIDEMFSNNDSDVRAVLKAIMEDPSVVDSDGKVKMFTLIKPTNLSKAAVERALSKIERQLRREYRATNEQN